MNYEEIIKDLENIVGKDNVLLAEEMSKHTSFKVGGKADIFLKVNSKELLEKIIKENDKWNIPVTIIGNGSNLLVSDDGIRGLVIKYIANKIEINECEATVDAGVINSVLAFELLKNELSGFEFASGIPGTIGGAIFMNAGAYGREMKDIVEEVTYIDLLTKKIYTIDCENCKFSYRKSVFESMHTIILSAKLKFEKGNKEEIQNTMNEYKQKRINTQPLDKPNAGSTFKRGEGFITAQLIDQAGLKGYTIGGAQVSTKHAGFIVNTGNAKAEDIINLIKFVQEKVYEKFNVKIETEVRVIK